MPQYLQSTYWVDLTWPIVAAPCLFAILAACGAILLTKSRDWGRIAASVFGFSILGMVTGFLTGLSGESTVLQAVLPSVLSVVGGLAAFLVSRDPKISDVVAPSIGALSLAVLLGAFWGANERHADELASNSIDYLKKRAGAEAELRLLRHNLSIPEEPPTLPLVPRLGEPQN
jgi:thiol:disulfide interchange protein